MIVNINQTCKVKLTEKGKKILFEYYRDWPGVPEDKLEKEFHLWELMQIFGPHVYNGCEIPFVNNVIDLNEKL
jgi:hypothetical protein